MHRISHYTGTKISKAFSLHIFMIVTLSSAAFSQATPNVIYDSLKKEIVMLNGTDSVASIAFDKSFRATLNHEKKKKKKTIYYRLAEYSNPINVSQVPVVIANSDILLHVEGTLQGDTVAKFSCIFKRKDNSIILETSTSEISTNQISFRVNIDADKYMTVNSLNPTSTVILRKKKDVTCLIDHDKKSRLVFNVYAKSK
jgi:hypothetical protein